MRPSRLSVIGGTLFALYLAAWGVAPSLIAQEIEELPSLTLSGAVALAQENYPGVRAARHGEAAAAAAVGQSTAERWPRLSSTASLTTFEEPMLVAPLHRFDIDAIPEFDETLLRGDLTLAWTLFDGGARGARVRGARAEAEGAVASRRAAEMSLTARVTRAYLEVLTARGILDAQDLRIATLVAERRRVDQLLGQGRAAQVELLRLDAALAGAEADRVAAAARLDLGERELARLVGLPAGAARAGRLLPVRLVGGRPPLEREALAGRARGGNPELERARQSVRASEAARRLAKAAWLPRLDLVGAYLGFGSSAGGGTAEWQAGVSFSYPLFTGGARISAVSSAGAGERRAREELRLAELGVEEAVDRALSATLEARALVSAVARAVEAQTEVVRIEQLSLQAGAGTQTDYLRAEAELLRVRSALVEARHAEIAAHVELARVVGELDAAWLDRNLEIAR